MTKKFFKPASAPVQKTPETIKPIEPVLELGKIEDSPEKKEGIGVIENPSELPITPEFAEINKYKVIAKGGLVLRETPPSDTNTTSGMYAGAGIICIPYGDNFVETERVNNWSCGNYNGRTGWVCNLYLEK